MNTPVNATHLFISYADEDFALAGWLARKLSTYGYAVWFDRMKMLGGEPWPQTIDEAIKQRSFRMLALMSAHSVHKPNPSKERTLALRIAKQRGIADFLITLKVDEAELDWLTTDISYIAFNRGWAGGFRRLLKKLDSIDTPKLLVNGPALAASTFSQGEDLLCPGEEELLANVMRVEGLPEVLRGYRLKHELTEEQQGLLEKSWSFHRFKSAEMIAFFPPPKAFNEAIEQTKEQYLWTACDKIRGANARDVAAGIVIQILQKRLLRAGFKSHPKQKAVLYLTEEFAEGAKLRFLGFNGKRTWIKIRGKATFFRVGHPKEINFHHYALRLRLARGLDRSLWLQITPSLFFFDGNGESILDKRVGPRRKRLTKGWWNHKWVNRLLAAEQIILNLPVEHHEQIELKAGFLRIFWNGTLNEGALEPVKVDETEEEDLEDLPILLDEERSEEEGGEDE